MKFIKCSALCIVFFLSVGLPMAHAEPFMDWYKKIGAVEAAKGFPIPKEDIKVLLKDAEPLIKRGSDDPRFYLQMGAFVKQLRRYYYEESKSLGTYDLNSPESQALIKEYQSYYRKALDADDKPDAPAHFEAYTLSAIADDVLAAPDVKERAYRKAIALAQAGKANIPNETYEYTTYQFLLESYSNQKNPDKYLETLNEMIDRFGSSEELEGYKTKVEVVIEKRDRKAALKASKVVAK